MSAKGLQKSIMTLVLAAMCTCSAYAADKQITIELKDVTVKDAMSTLFTKAGYKYKIKGSIDGTVHDFSVSDTQFDIVLKELLHKYNLTFSEKNNLYIIEPLKADNKTDSNSDDTDANNSQKQPSNLNQNADNQDIDGVRVTAKFRDTGIYPKQTQAASKTSSGKKTKKKSSSSSRYKYRKHSHIRIIKSGYSFGHKTTAKKSTKSNDK